MSRLVALWNQFSIAKKLALVGVVAATLASFGFLATAPSRASMALLYGGLDDAAAGDVLAALQAMDIRAEARGQGIYVPESKRDSARLALARQGLPQQGQPGFELLDNINGYATTSEMFNAAYWRAKEGELSRTILSTPGIKSVRVHLGIPQSSSFSRNRRPASASATIRMASGRLDVPQATAIRFLIALAVPNLEPEQVAIIDAVRGVILKPGAATPSGDGAAEGDRAKLLEMKLMDLLEARVGPGNARVTVSLDLDKERETVSERILDPESRVLTNRNLTESSESGTEAPRAVTVASNLPDGDAAAGGEPSQSDRTETQETTQYQYSEVSRQRQKEPGAVMRTNVAVLLNEKISVTEEGESEITPRTEEEIQAIRDLVAASVGFDEARGDVITVRSMSFHEIVGGAGELTKSSPMDFVKANLLSILQIVIPALVILALAMFVIKPILTQDPSALAADPLALSADAAPISLAAPGARDGGVDSPVDEMRALASANAETSTKVLKAWLGETEEIA